MKGCAVRHIVHFYFTERDWVGRGLRYDKIRIVVVLVENMWRGHALRQHVHIHITGRGWGKGMCVTKNGFIFVAGGSGW